MVTYRRFHRVLQSLGLTIEVSRGAWVCVHETYGVLHAFPILPLDDEVRWYHMASMAALLDGFGVVDRKEFEAMLPPNPNDLGDLM